MRRARSPAPFNVESGDSNQPTVERSFWMKSESCRQRPKWRFCARSRSAHLNGSVGSDPSRLMYACWLPQTGIWMRRSKGSFRKDLFYRLNVFPVHVPALRERGADIPLLVEYLVARYAQRTGKRIQRIGNETMGLFKRYSWPGNVRELQNVIERAVILCDGETFSVDAS